MSTNTLSIYGLEARYEFLRTLRMPAFAVPTLLFPAMFYVFFGIVFAPRSGGNPMSSYLLASYGCFGVIGPALFGFGAGVAVERGLGWLTLKRATPMPPGAYFAAKLAMSLTFAALVVAILFALGAGAAGVRLSTAHWAGLAFSLIVGAIPFCAMGLAIGFWVSPQAAPAIVNLVYLPMSFFSGLWIPIEAFPKALQNVALALPPFHFLKIALHASGLKATNSLGMHVGVLVVFTVACLGVALAGYRRSAA